MFHGRCHFIDNVMGALGEIMKIGGKVGRWFCLIVCCILSGPMQDVCAWEGSVVSVPDGDTLEVARGREICRVRLYGIDSPEYDQSHGRESAQYARALLQGEYVEIEPLESDQYGRTVALVRRSGLVVNREMVRKGLAWVYPQYCHLQPICAEMKTLERAAKNQRLGLWRDDSPEPPWKWRRQRR